MPVLTLLELKDHLKLDTSQTLEDARLDFINEAAQDYAEKYLGRSLPWADEEGNEVPVPASVKAAMLLIADDIYENGSGQFIGTIRASNPAVENMLHFYRVGMGV